MEERQYSILQTEKTLWDQNMKEAMQYSFHSFIQGNLLVGALGRWYYRHFTAILHKVQNLVHKFYRVKQRAECIVVKSKGLTFNRPHGTPVHQKGRGEKYVISISYLNKFREDQNKEYCIQDRIWNISLQGSGKHNQKEDHLAYMNKMEGQRWSQYCQHFYTSPPTSL